MTAIAEISARIQQIRGDLGIDTAPVVSGTSSTGAAGSAGSSTFASALADAQGTTGIGAAKGSGVTGQDVVAQARKYLGIPYVWGGTNPKVGLDCSGLVQLVYKKMGVSLPRVSQDQAHEGRRVDGLKNAKPGDLLTFGNPATHIGIYAGDGKMLHAPRTGDVVKVVDLSTYYRKPTDIRRVLPDAAAAGVGASTRPAGLSGIAGAAGISNALAKVPYANLFIKAGEKHGISPALLAAVAKTESSFNPRAVSPAGARGLMQIMPATARGIGVDPMNPADAVDGAARILKQNLKTFNGSQQLALAAYNAGPGAVQKYGGVPPYAETQAYVRKVAAAAAALG